MSGRRAAGTGNTVASSFGRLLRAWKVLPHESRLAAFASAALFLTLFLPWYQLTLIVPAKAARLQSASATITGWSGFSFVEAAVLLVAAGVLTLLFQRAEGRAFHLPGGDGAVITAAGLWTCVLIVWRMFDKQGATTNGPSVTTSGIEWGIFVALGAAAFLAYAGSRIRAAHRPEPPLPGEAGAPVGWGASAQALATDRPRRPRRAPEGPVFAGDWRAATAPDRPHGTPPPRSPSRVSAAELFERVVPEDPPTVPFGGISRRDDRTIARNPAPVTPAGNHAQLGEDDTLPLPGDDTLPLPGDDTLPLREDDTVPLGEDDTVPVDRRRRSR